MHTRILSPTDRLFFPLMGLTVLAMTFAGFAPTYYLKPWWGGPPLAAMVHVHAAAFTVWVLLLLSQSVFVRTGRLRWHRALGKVAAGLVAVMVVTGYMVIFGKPRPTVASRVFIFTPIVSLVLFPMLVAAAIHFRRDPPTHKRLMLLATVLIATAGVQRMMSMLGFDATRYRAYAVTYLLLLLPLILYDLVRLKRLHRATAWGAVVVLARHPLHEAVAYTDHWQRIAAWLTPPV